MRLGVVVSGTGVVIWVHRGFFGACRVHAVSSGGFRIAPDIFSFISFDCCDPPPSTVQSECHLLNTK